MVLSKLDLALVAVVAAGMLWFEHDHRVFVGTPAAAAATPPAASVCPDTDDVPFSADCIKFIDGGELPDMHARMSAAAVAPAVSPHARGRADLLAPACPPSNENAPYSADCIKFLSGWYWQPDPSESAR
jgi:hypothetical protein